MHPNAAFHSEASTLLDQAARIGFAHLFVATPAGPMVAHAPITRHGERLRCHLARANRLHPHLAGATVLLSLAGPQGYVSPTWYAQARDQVPTWNYVSVEIDGIARGVTDAALLEHLDALADAHEPGPDSWTRAQTDPGAIAAMLPAIEGFEIEVSAARGTNKLGQNKPGVDRAGVVAGLRALAEAMSA